MNSIELIDSLIALGKREQTPDGYRGFKLTMPEVSYNYMKYISSLSGEEVSSLLASIMVLLSYVGVSESVETGQGEKNGVLLARNFMEVLTTIFDQQTQTDLSIPKLLTECQMDPYKWAANVTSGGLVN